ncbi:MAG: ATP-binding protein [Deltaproteobacteria bacterium]|nr:ATP-binding protein [Deltaproteobacteria bacterium]
MSEGTAQRFSVDVAGLLRALTEQFPDPLLCVRELVQNAADAGSARIDVDVSFDAKRGLLRLSVEDDGRGMSAEDVEGYLTIGFSEKDPAADRGRFGVGKLSPYALGINRMLVETSNGRTAHRITFFSDGSGHIEVRPSDGRAGTAVRVFKRCERVEAEQLAARTLVLVEERCGSVSIPLFVNGQRANKKIDLSTPYAVRVATPEGVGFIGIGAEPVRVLMGGGIVLETDAEILGPEISYVLDSPRLSPTLSRNAVRRDGAFEALLRAARAREAELSSRVATALAERVTKLRQRAEGVERLLEPDDRAALEWLRRRLLDPEGRPPDESVRRAPVIETADGGLVSADELVAVIRREGRVPASRVPRPRDDLAGYFDRGVPVLLLYRDLEDFLERQEIRTVEIDAHEDGREVSPVAWGPGETALAERAPRPAGASRGPRLAFAGALAAFAVGFIVATRAPNLETPASSVPVGEAPRLEVPSSELVQREEPVSPVETSAPPARVAVHEASLPAGRFHSGRFAKLSPIAALAGAFVSVALTLALLLAGAERRRRKALRWLMNEASAPLTVGEAGSRRFDVLRRALLHPIDFFVARGWSIRAAGDRSLQASSTIHGYRELAPELPIRSGVRLDLDRVAIGFVDLVSPVGEPHDGRILVRRGHRALLNRNHPTVRHLISLAEVSPARARVMLDVLLATDLQLASGTDPRQVEWDLLGRAERALSAELDRGPS